MKYLKKSYDDLKPYFSKNIEEGIILNANEAGYNPPLKILEKYFEALKNVDFNRYPDMMNTSLCYYIAKAYGVKPNQVCCGVGSDELLEVTFRAVLESGDNVISFSPSFSMYNVFAYLCGANFIPVYFNDNYTFNIGKMIQAINKYKPKIVCICSPNNPTGQVISKTDIERIVYSTDALVLLDLAYVDFAEEDYTNLAVKYDNLIVFRTFSKAYALASIRCGYAISKSDNINLINAVKAPYSLSTQSALLASIAIRHKNLYLPLINEVKKERSRVYTSLKELGFDVIDSQANFLFINMDDKYNDELLRNKIYIRKFMQGKYRITIGKKEENDKLIEVLKCVSQR